MQEAFEGHPSTVAHVIVPGQDGDAIVDLIPKHLDRSTLSQNHESPEQQQVTGLRRHVS